MNIRLRVKQRFRWPSTPLGITAFFLLVVGAWFFLAPHLLPVLLKNSSSLAYLTRLGIWLLLLGAAGLLYLSAKYNQTAVQNAAKALTKHEDHLRQLSEYIDQVFWISSPDHSQMIYVSPVCEQICGRSCKSLCEQPGRWTNAIHPDDRARVLNAFAQEWNSEYTQEYRLIRPDGGICWIRERVFPILNENGRVYRVCGLAHDVTEQKLVQQRLELQVEERTRDIERRQQVAEGLRDILKVLNSNRPLDEILDYIVIQARYLLAADAVAIYRLQPNQKMLTIQAAQGLPAEYITMADIPVGQAVTGQAVSAGRPVALSDLTAPSLLDQIILDSKRQKMMEYIAKRYRALLAVPLNLKEEPYGSMTLYFREARHFTGEEIKSAVAFGDQAALAVENARLRTQLQKSAVAAERDRLARELHDSVTQTLFSASLMADVLPLIWERDQAQAQQSLEELSQLTRGALAEMRTLLLELRPPAALSEASIIDLLRQLGEATTGRARLPVSVEVDCPQPPPAEVRVALYRIAQEALNNVAKHASASRAAISLRCVPGHDRPNNGPTKPVEWLELRICDDGRGFQSGPISSEHLGLNIMRERAETIGAKLSIQSRPGRGTEIRVTWQSNKPVP